MIGLLIRLIMGRSAGGFWVGLVMLLAGVGLTVASYEAVLTAGGGTYLIFYGLIIGGLIRMVTGIPSAFGSARGRRGELPLIPTSFMAPPSEMSPGFCWQCGGRVKQGRAICMHCGATMPVTPPDPSSTAQAAGFAGAPNPVALPYHLPPNIRQMGDMPPPGGDYPPYPYEAPPYPYEAPPYPYEAPPYPYEPPDMPGRGMPPGMMPPGMMPPGGPAPGWDPRMAGMPPGARARMGAGPRRRRRPRPTFMPATIRERAEDLRERAEEFRERAEGLLRPFFSQRGWPEPRRGRGPEGYRQGGYGPGGYGPGGNGPPRGFRSREDGPPEYGPPRYGPGRGAPTRRGPREQAWDWEDDDDDGSVPDFSRSSERHEPKRWRRY